MAAIIWFLAGLLWTGTQGVHPDLASIGIAVGAAVGAFAGWHMTRKVETKGEVRAAPKYLVLLVLLIVLAIPFVVIAGIPYTDLRFLFPVVMWAPTSAWFSRSIYIQWWEHHTSRKLYSDGLFSTRVSATPVVTA